MPVTALGPVSEPLQTLKSLCINSQAFIDRCAFDGLTPANQVFIHALRPANVGEVIVPAQINRPFILIKMRDFIYNEFSEACMQPKGLISMHVNDKFRYSDFQDSVIDFANFYGQLIEDISERNVGDASLVMRQINQSSELVPVGRKEEQDDYKFFTVEFDVSIGADFP